MATFRKVANRFLLKHDIAEIDLHRWASMHLKGKQTAFPSLLLILIDYLGHHLSVDVVDKVIPICGNPVGIPFVLLNFQSKLGLIANLFHRFNQFALRVP